MFDKLVNQNARHQAQPNTPLNEDFVDNNERDFKRESRRNKKSRFRKSNKHHRAEK